MLIRIGYELIFDVPAPTPMLLMLDTHPSRDGSIVRGGPPQLDPYIPMRLFVDPFGNRVGQIVAPAGKVRIWNEGVISDSGEPDAQCFGASQTPVDQLPLEALPFLLASRYCEVDKMSNLAWGMFGNIPPGGPRVKAVCDFVHNHIQFGYAYASPTKTAWDAYVEKRGVCRDYMHLAITFIRALAIPARYATGYLGDIGVPVVPEPMDFSAWFEVFLDGRWWTLDARHNSPRIGRILMARGRDATDVALTTSFGPTTLEKFVVVTDEIPAAN